MYSEYDINKKVNDTLNLINQANEVIKNSVHQDLVLVLGNSGVGKTPFTKWMTEDNTKLISVRSAPGKPYLMQDNDNKIGNSTTKSATVLSDLFVNQTINQAYYDFPGFKDTRGMSYGIATMYSMQGIISKAKSVKMVFLVDYDSVKTAGSRDGFTGLIKSATNFIKDIGKFNSSIALVVSKVPKYINDEPLSNDQVIQIVANFIEQDVKPNLEKKDNAYYTQAIKFIDTILSQDGNDYPKIGLFRYPDQEGPFSNIPLVHQGKERIEKIIYEKLSFTEIAKDDFVCTVDDSYQNDISNVVQKIKDILISNVEKIGEKIKQHFLHIEETIADIGQLYNKTQAGYYELLETQKKAINLTSSKECIELVTKSSATINNNIINNTLLDTTTHYTNFLAFLGSNKISLQAINSFKCTTGLDKVVEYLEDAKKWYGFLTELNARLLGCYTHQNLQNYDIANLVVEQDKNKKVSEINLKHVLKKLSYSSSSLDLQYNNIKDLILDELKFKHLKTVQNSASQYNLEHPSCAPSNVIITNNSSIAYLYDTLGFVNELNMYESLFYNLHENISFLPFYESLLNRVDKYKENPTKKLENGAKLEDHKTVLNYLYTAILSKIHSINNNLENYLVVDIKEYLNLATKHIEEYKKKLKEVKIDTSRGQYQDKINTEITKANEIIEQDILPEINKVYEEIDINISSLIKDIVNQQKEAAEEKGKLIEQQNKLAAQLPLRALLGVVKVSSQFLALAGPMGSVAAGTIGFATDIGEKTLLDKADPLLAANAKKSLDQVTSYYKSEQAFLKVNLELSKISLSRDARSKNSDDLKVIEKKIEPLKNLLNQNFVRDNVYYDEKVHTKQELQQYYKTLSEQKAELEKEQDPTKTKNKLEKDKENADFNKAQKEKTIETQLKATMYASNMLNIGEVGYYQVTRYQKSEEEIAILGNSIKQVSNRIDKLKKYEYNIYNTMMPACKEFRSSLNNTGKMLSNKTHTGIDVIKWRVQDTIKDFQLQLQEMLQGADNSGLQAKFMRCIDKLQSGMLTMSQIYDRIQDFHDKAQLANYIADLNSYAEIKTSDNELNDNIHKLELMIQSNIVVQEYMKAVSAFKQSIFPFAELYLGYFNLPQHLRLVNISGLVNDAIKQVSFIADQITKDATVVKNKPYHIFPNIRFDSTNFEKKPFFVWKHDTNKEEISKLLQGQEIIIKADITRGIQQNAIKFREVGIHFILLDKTMQAELDEQLSHFLVDMTHLGNSYYRCNNKYYIITHDIINIQHSVNKDNNTQSYSHLDETYTIIQGNAPIFSPYTIWKIKLLSKDTDNNYFNALRKYINQTIDLALEGYGKYIELGIGVCNEKLERHYKVADNILQLDTNHNGENHYRGRRDTGDNNIPYDADNVTVNNIKNDISNFKDQNIDTIDNMSTEDTSSSASSIRSPINTVIYWLSNGIAQLRFFSSASLVSYEYVKDGIQSIFGASKQINNDITQDYSSNTMNIAKCNVNESLTLADFLIRCVTKVKPYNTKEESIDLLYTRAYVSNVIVKYQEMLNDLSIQNNLPAEDLEFNPLDLMSRLEKEIINGDPRKLGKILYQHTVNNNTNYDSSEIEEKINKILEHKSEQFTYNQELYTDDTSNSSTILEDMTNTIIGIAADINHTDYQSEVNMIG